MVDVPIKAAAAESFSIARLFMGVAEFCSRIKLLAASPRWTVKQEDCALRVPDLFGCDAQLRLSLKRRDKSIGRWHRSIPWYQSARRALPRSKGLSPCETRWC